MSTPSLLIVPARLKAGTLFSQIPTNGSGDFTVVQAVGNATRYNSSGFVESAKTNLILRSEEFDNAYWSKSRMNAFGSGSVANATTAPDGTMTADYIQQQTGETIVGGVFRAISVTSSTIYTLAVFAKQSDARYLRLGFAIGAGGAGIFCNFDLQDGIAGTPSAGITPRITNFGNGWFRCSITATSLVTASALHFIYQGNSLNASTATPDTGIFIWGAQLEEGSSASEYIPTTTVARTRFAGVTVDGTVAANIPRLDYYTSNGTPGCPGLLVEPAATNTLSGSVSLDTGWAITADTTVTSGIVSPSESTNATLFQATVNTSRVRQTATLASGSTYTFSCFGKFGALSSGFSLNVFDENSTTYGSGVCQAFNLNEGTLGASGTVGAGFTLQSVGMENYGNGWYRCRMTVLMGYTPTTPRVGFRIGTQITGRPLSVVSGTVNAWGAQLEVGSVATSYIPTTTGTVTRNADVISASGNVSGSIGQTEGSIYVEVDIQKLLGTTQRAFIDIGQAGNRLFLGYGNGLTNKIRFLLQTSSGGLVDFESAATTTGIIRIAVGYKNNDSAMYVNGVSVSPLSNGSFTATLTSLTQLSIGSSFSVGETHFLNDKINAVALYGTRLSNDALMLLSMQGNDAYLPQAIWNFYEDSRAGNTEVPTCLYERHADIIDV